MSVTLGLDTLITKGISLSTVPRLLAIILLLNVKGPIAPVSAVTILALLAKTKGVILGMVILPLGSASTTMYLNCMVVSVISLT